MEEMFINIEYTFSSSLGVDAEYKYIKVVKGKVFNGEFADNTENEFIGQIVFKILSLDEAKQDGFDIYQIFDNHEYTFRHGKSFYNFIKGDFKAKIYQHFDQQLLSDNVCFIEYMSLKNAYKKLGLGAKVFKDIVTNFRREVSLFVIQPYPLQFANIGDYDEIKDIVELKSIEKDRLTGAKKISTQYQTWGFEKIKGITDILFFNADLKNEKFDAIEMDV